MRFDRPRRSATGLAPGLLAAGFLATAGLVGACGPGAPAVTPPITPGTSGTPRDVNIVAHDYAFVPPVVDLVPGETVNLRVVNGGLAIHEAILGDMADQLAWEAAEGVTEDAPPGPTPVVEVPSGFEGVRIVVESGQRRDMTWTVPFDAASASSGWFVGCHIPGHWQKGMVVPVRFVDRGGQPPGSPPPVPTARAGDAVRASHRRRG
jgi:uncharacterized cupredoxin-like copper-binding protein